MPFLSIILPAHNEVGRLPETLKNIEAYLAKQTYTYELIVVENGSSDQTLEVAQSFREKMPYLRVLHEDLGGKGRAVRRGMLEAVGDYRFFCDVDFSMPMDQINRFFPPILQGIDIAIGSREAPGAVRYDEPVYRHLAGRVFTNLVKFSALPTLEDTQCGFKCFTRRAAENIFKFQTMMGWSFDVEILYIAQRRGFKITEVAIPWYYNSQSRIHMAKDSWDMLRDIITIRRNGRLGLYDQKP